MIKAIIKYPDPVLLRVATPVTHQEGLDILADLNETIKAVTWGTPVGLAAPQIGISKRVFLADSVGYINPTLVKLPKGGDRIYQEGCYSLQDSKFDYRVTRRYAIRLSWTDTEGEIHHKIFTGRPAQIIQHEYDHLEGKLCSGQKEGV